ncbi:unnamed protein product [Caenorhabditis auriculariae]|uniref:Uncharacterized protein n=1 Tax=Caenorhabditis auriculariae TaxID=2777116 RepID=A0A8S1HP75_9PELO|nr:unnamed protein product [Caenorhabditis auriculariae]
MAKIGMVVQKPADSKWSEVYSPRRDHYVYMLVTMFVTTAMFTQSCSIMASLTMLIALIEATAIYRDNACFLLILLFLNTICAVAQSVYCVTLFQLLSVPGGVTRAHQKGDLSPFAATVLELVFELVLLAMMIHQLLLTLWVYRHASNKKIAAHAVEQVAVETV